MERYGVIQVAEGQYRNSFRKFANLDYMAHYFRYHLEDYYGRVRCPMLLLPGEDLLENPRAKAAMEGLSQLSHSAQIADLHGWQHPYGWMVDPDAAVEVIQQFLATQGN